MSNNEHSKGKKDSFEAFWNKVNSEAMTRQEIYDVLRQTGKNAFLDQELKRLGFWDPERGGESASLQQLRQERQQLELELHNLQKDFTGKESALERQQEAREERKRASKEKQEKNKLHKEKARKARAKRWKRKKRSRRHSHVISMTG